MLLDHRKHVVPLLQALLQSSVTILQHLKSPLRDVMKLSHQTHTLPRKYWLADRLKACFPRLQICLLMDALFADGPTFSICEKYHWKYIIVLQEGYLPAVEEEFTSLLDCFPQGHICFRTADHYKTVQDFHWVNDTEYVDAENDEHTVSVMRCLESKPCPKGNLKTTRFK